MFLPIATDTSIRRTPLVNYGLIGVNVFIFMLQSMTSGGHRGRSVLAEWIEMGVLNGDAPRLYQFFTYQFLHADVMHLVGNMLFLWLFGNATNAKMGNLPYLMFYLAGGVFAATGYTFYHEHNMIGASGAIASVTTAYLALFPRSRVTILYIWFFIGTFELPSMILIIFKMILWDNIMAPGLIADGASNVAFSAHLAGYAFGFVSIAVMMSLHWLPRDQFDIIALWKRYFQRQSLRSATSGAEAPARAQYGRVARPVSVDTVTVRMASPVSDDPVTELRSKISEALSSGDRDTAANLYARLMELDPRQVLGRTQQLDVANQLVTQNRMPQAAAAYEKYLVTYPSAAEAIHVKLLLGIIYARDLQQYEVAEEHLRQCLERIADEKRREQCQHWLTVSVEGKKKPN